MRRAHRTLTRSGVALAAALALGWGVAGVPGRGTAPVSVETASVAPAAGLDSRRAPPRERLHDRRAGSSRAAPGGGPGAGGSTPPRERETPGRLRPAEAHASSTDDSRDDTSSLLWPTLAPIEPTADRLTVRVVGHDPVGGRAIALWRREPDGGQPAVPVAWTRSTPDGGFDFGELPLPNDGVAWAVTAGGTDPRAPSPVRVTPPLPAPSVVAHVDGGSVSVDLHPSVLRGELIVVDARGAVVARLDATARAHWTIPPERLDHDLRVVHVLPDGRRTRHAAVYVAP